MKRRAFLGTAVSAGTAAISGCSSADSSSAEPPANAKRSVTVEVTGSVPDDAPLEFSLSVEDQWVTDESTATLAGTVENVGDGARNRRPPYYKGTSGEAGQEGLLLYNLEAADSPPSEYVPPCFADTPDEKHVETDESGEHVLWTLEGYLGPELASGESTTDTILVVDDPTASGCLPDGRYEFRPRFSYGDDRTFEWPFTVTVEDVASA